MGDFQSLKVWKKAAEYAEVVYRATERFPDRERYGLAAHLRKTAISVLSNIAEGGSRNSGSRDFANFVRIALGSLGEARAQSYIAGRLGFVDRPTAVDLSRRAHELRAMLEALRRNAEGSNSHNSELSTLD